MNVFQFAQIFGVCSIFGPVRVTDIVQLRSEVSELGFAMIDSREFICEICSNFWILFCKKSLSYSFAVPYHSCEVGKTFFTLQICLFLLHTTLLALYALLLKISRLIVCH